MADGLVADTPEGVAGDTQDPGVRVARLMMKQQMTNYSGCRTVVFETDPKAPGMLH